jgi:two-component system, LuxR family, sensor kinase FixL
MSTPGLATDEKTRESRGFLSVLFHRAADVYFLIDLEGRIVDSNAAGQKMMGWRLEELIGRIAFDSELHLVCPESVADVAVALGENAQGRAAPPREYVLRHKDGSEVIAEVSSVPVTIEGQTFVLGIARDMTERKREVRESAARLQQLQTQLAHVARVSTAGEMLAGIAHEISQPLFAIGNLAKACEGALAQPDADRARLRSWIGQIDEAVSRGGEIIRRLRSYLEPSRFDRRPVKIVEVVGESIRLAMAEGRGRPICAEQGPGSADAIVDMDAIQIEQVLVNLLRNAAEAMEGPSFAGGKVSVRTERDGDLVRVAVSDDGPGLPRELCDRLFDPFVTTKPGGLGMGLAICRTIVEAHGGRIWAESVAPHGARFCFTLRVVQPTP